MEQGVEGVVMTIAEHAEEQTTKWALKLCSLISIVGMIKLRTVPWHGSSMNAAVKLDHDVC